MIGLLARLPDRMMHRRRGRAARALVRQAGPVRSILVVCYGNRCRSPYAAAALRRELVAAGLSIDVSSAGYAFPNRQPPQEAIDEAAARGLDVSAHRSAVVNPASLEAADIIVAMSPRQARAVTRRQAAANRVVILLGDLDPLAIERREIADPIGADRAVFAECFSRIDRCMKELAGALRARQ
jgi:protein-tyrosine-phosphatase